MSLKWDDQLSVGNSTIDTDHKELILLAQDISDVIKMRQLDLLGKLFASLEVLMQRHFLNEEKLAIAVTYEFSEHKRSHLSLLSEIKYLHIELLGKNEWSFIRAMHYCMFLENWLIDHIIIEDMKMKPALLTLPPQ